jgi:hypothetical protein
MGTLSKPYKDEFNYVLVVAVAMATATTYSTKTVDNIYKMLIRSHPVGQPATAGPLFILFYFISKFMDDQSPSILTMSGSSPIDSQLNGHNNKINSHRISLSLFLHAAGHTHMYIP